MEPEDIAPRPARRFVPTLTEVISDQPEDAAAPLLPPLFTEPGQTDSSTATAPPPSAVSQELAEAVLSLIGADLDRMISRTVSRVLHEQMLGFNTRLQKAVAEVVRDAVARSGM